MKIPHMSMAPPALEAPSRFALKAIRGSGLRSRSRRRTRALQLIRRAALCGGAAAVLALVLASHSSRHMLFTFATQVWGRF
ncbi:MAG: hypothetical protein ABW032_07265 [Burkholderiaceae bacterium]